MDTRIVRVGVGACALVWGALLPTAAQSSPPPGAPAPSSTTQPSQPAAAPAPQPSPSPGLESEPSARTGAPAAGQQHLDSGEPGDPDSGDTARTDPFPETDEHIVVEGRAPRDPLSPASRRVDAADVANTPRRSADDLLRLVPGLHIAQHAAEGKAQQFFLRGFDAVHGSDVRVRVAGVPVNEPSNIHGHGYVDIGFAIPEVVVQIAARSGSFALDQGDFATAGSVDFDLGVAAPARGTRVTYEAGTTNRHRVLGLVAPRNASEATFAAFEAVTDDGFGGNRASRRASVLGQHRLHGTARHTLDATVGAYAARFGEPGVTPAALVDVGALDFYDAVVDDGSGESSRALAVVRGRRRTDGQRTDVHVYGQWRRLRLVENFTGFLTYPDMGDARDQRHNVATAGARANVIRALAGGLEIVAVASARSDWLTQSERQVDGAGMPWRNNSDVEAWLGAAGAGLGLRGRWSWLRADLGGRADALAVSATDTAAEQIRRGEQTFVAVSPRGRVAVDLSDDWVAFAAYGRGFRSPEARAVAAGDDSTRYTTSRSVETGLDARPVDGVQLTLTGFATWMSNEVLFDHIAGTSLLRNATRRFGGELAVAARVAPWLRLQADLTAVRARFVDSGEPVPGVPPALGRVQARAARGPWVASALMSAMAPRPLAHGARGSAFAVVDVLAGYRGGRFAVDLQIDNLFDSQWREAEYHFASRFDGQAPPSQIPRLHFAPGRPLGARLAFTARF